MHLSVALSALLLVVTAASAGAQAVSVYAPPPDLTAPPADAVKSPSGLISKVITPGTGTDKPALTDIITVDYSGWTTAGTLYDSTYSRGKAAMFPLNRTALKGWTECIQLMVVGEKRRCWMPQPLAYNGQKDRPEGQMVFEIVLKEVHSNPTAPPPDVKAPPADASRTASGLAYKVLRPGTGKARPRPGDKVLVHYSGWTTNGRLFDSSFARGEAATLDLDEVIKGWGEGLQLMVEGERTRFWIPQDLAYKGEPGSPRGTLVFDVELVQIQ